MSATETEREQMRERADSFQPDDYEYEDRFEHPPDLDQFYGPLKNYTRMVTRGYQRLFMLDAPGGLGKTYNVKQVLNDELQAEQWSYHRGFTTPVELFKTLWKARHDGHVLFLDDMSGIRSNKKAIDMLKAATESDGEENWVEYRSSQSIEHPNAPNESLGGTFCFRGRIVMSFNDTPNSNDFDALKDRGVFYEFDLSYQERLELLREASKLNTFSDLPVEEQQEVAEWIATVTNPAVEVSLRTLEEVCSMRHFGQREGEDWERMAFEVFGLDYEKHLIIRLRESDMSVEEQRDVFKDKTGRSRGYYYDLLEEIKSERME